MLLLLACSAPSDRVQPAPESAITTDGTGCADELDVQILDATRISVDEGPFRVAFRGHEYAFEGPREVWALPVDESVVVRRGCASEVVHTGALDDELGGFTVGEGALDPTRFLMPFRRQDGSNAAMLVDEQGDVVWVGELPTRGNPKGIGLRDGHVYVLGDSKTMDDPAEIYVLAPDGSLETHTAPVALHHDIEVRDDAIYGVGWDLREHLGEQVLGDTLVRFTLDGDVDALWNAWEAYPTPTQDTLDQLSGQSGTYDGDVIAWTYVNSISQNPRTGRVAATNGAGDQGPIVVDAGVWGQANTPVPEALGDGVTHPFDKIHSAWVHDDGRLRLYNRRGSGGSSMDVWQLGEDAGDPLTFVSTRLGAVNETVGAAQPVDDGEDGIVLSHPNPLGTIEVVDATGDLLLRLEQPDRPDSTHIGYVHAYSFQTLNP